MAALSRHTLKESTHRRIDIRNAIPFANNSRIGILDICTGCIQTRWIASDNRNMFMMVSIRKPHTPAPRMWHNNRVKDDLFRPHVKMSWACYRLWHARSRRLSFGEAFLETVVGGSRKAMVGVLGLVRGFESCCESCIQSVEMVGNCEKSRMIRFVLFYRDRDYSKRDRFGFNNIVKFLCRIGKLNLNIWYKIGVCNFFSRGSKSAKIFIKKVFWVSGFFLVSNMVNLIEK